MLECELTKWSATNVIVPRVGFEEASRDGRAASRSRLRGPGRGRLSRRRGATTLAAHGPTDPTHGRGRRGSSASPHAHPPHIFSRGWPPGLAAGVAGGGGRQGGALVRPPGVLAMARPSPCDPCLQCARGVGATRVVARLTDAASPCFDKACKHMRPGACGDCAPTHCGHAGRVARDPLVSLDEMLSTPSPNTAGS